MGLTGDFAALRKLVADMNELKSGTLRKATDAARDGSEEQYQEDFREQRDPWGSAWAPNQDGSSPVLYKSGALAGADFTGAAGTVRAKPPKYWVFHQIGANNMKQRAVLPFSDSLWDRPIQDEIEQAIFAHFGR